MIAKFLSALFKNNKVPPEYKPWLNDIVPFIKMALSNVNKKALNKDRNHKARVLLALYVIGVVNYYQQANNLSYGQYRFLGVKVLESNGWNYETASFIFDRANEISKFMPELEGEGEDAIDSGIRSGRAYFEEGDLRAGIMPRVKLLQWEKKGLYAP